MDLLELVSSFISHIYSRMKLLGSHGSSVFSFVRNLHTVSHSGCIYIPNDSVQALPFLHIFANIYLCSLWRWPYWQVGEGNGTPLQYSCLENPMDGGAWWAAVHGVAKSWTQLSDLTFTFHFHALEKEMATHSSVLALRIPGTAEPGGLPSMGSHRVGHDWRDLAAAAAVYQERSTRHFK